MSLILIGKSIEYSLKLRGVGYHPENESEKPEEVKFYEDLPTCRAYVGEEG
jgi:hypothetical protein